jgi:hypothetical protein
LYKTCYQCKKEKEFSQFHKSKRKGGLATYCKACTHDTYACRVSDPVYRAKLNTESKDRYKKTGGFKHRELGWRQYGIVTESGEKFTEQEYNRIFQIQGGKCAICEVHQSLLKRALSVDHNHETGTVRGLLCNRCNWTIGLFNDQVKLMSKAAEYLNK